MTFRKRSAVISMVMALILTLIAGCSSLKTPDSKPTPPSVGQEKDKNGTSQVPVEEDKSSVESSSPSPDAKQSDDATKALLLTIRKRAEEGKVLNCDFPAKTTVYQEVVKAWGRADTTKYIAEAKGRYATYSNRNIVFGVNKGEQIFEVRSFDSHQFSNVSLEKVKEVFGPPQYDAQFNGQEIIGYTAGPDFKIELVFPQSTTSTPNPSMDHYNVLYPQGTVNSMADDPGRQW